MSWRGVRRRAAPWAAAPMVTAPRGTAPVVGLVVALVVGLGACSGDDADGRTDDDAGAAAVDEPVGTVTVAPPSSAPATTTTTTEPEPPLSERLSRVEVSARIASGEAERIVSITTDAEVLAGVADPGDPLLAAAWCSGVPTADPGPFVVRVTDDAVGEATGGLVGFELLGADPVATVGAAELTASLRLALDDGDEVVVPDASVVLTDDPSTGTFGGTTVDGVVVEGAFRCE